MRPAHQPSPDEEVEQLLLNGHLRDELEPFQDESIEWLDRDRLPTEVENRFLSAMLAWELAPTLPIARWFRTELRLPPPDQLSDAEVHSLLHETIRKLFRKKIVLEFTEHLSDRQLYTLILRDILPAREKKLDDRENYLHWDCCDAAENPDVFLEYYATPEEREAWEQQYPRALPPHTDPPYPRNLPKRPL